MNEEDLKYKIMYGKIKKLISKKNEIIKNENPKFIFKSPKRKFRNYCGSLYFAKSIENYEKANQKIKAINKKFIDIMKSEPGLDLYYFGSSSDDTASKKLASRAANDFEYSFHSYYVEAFLNLPAPYFCKSFFEDNYIDEPITDFFYDAMTGYDNAPLIGISYYDRRIQNWIHWYEFNILNLKAKTI